MKNVGTSRRARSDAVGTVMPLNREIACPRSSSAVAGSSTMTAPNMYGWILHQNTYRPGVWSVTDEPAPESKGIPAAPVGKIRLVTVWPGLDCPEDGAWSPGATMASD